MGANYPIMNLHQRVLSVLTNRVSTNTSDYASVHFPENVSHQSSTVSDMYMYINSYCNNTGTIIGFAHDYMLSYMPDIVYMTGRFAVCMRGRDGRSVLRHGGVDGPF